MTLDPMKFDDKMPINPSARTSQIPRPFLSRALAPLCGRSPPAFCSPSPPQLRPARRCSRTRAPAPASSPWASPPRTSPRSSASPARSRRAPPSAYLPQALLPLSLAHLLPLSPHSSQQDKLAVESHRRAAAARASGHFKREIVPVQTKVKNEMGEMEDLVVADDDGIRGDASPELLGKLPPAFKKGGSTTAGNSSQVTDGAGCVLLARRSYAKAKGLPVIGVWRSFSVVGVDPALMARSPPSWRAPPPPAHSPPTPRRASPRTNTGEPTTRTHRSVPAPVPRRASARRTPSPRRSARRASARATWPSTSSTRRSRRRRRTARRSSGSTPRG